MTSEETGAAGTEIYGAWGAVLPGEIRAQLAVVGRSDQYAVIYRAGDDEWDTLAYVYDAEAATRTGLLIAKMTKMPEHLRIGASGVETGSDTEHPGVEWVVPTAVVDDPDPIVRITGPGTDRLWALPSTDGEVLGLLNPDGDPRELAEFTSAVAADAFIAMIDALFALSGSRGYTENPGVIG
ncbi:MAG: hypothetical protein WAW85_10785 [Gordonia sp. (in: high G+C Gram-positive bacteria)]|uniref:hypothetical protein n=1 Tax=Gordonia sp. (in: high G+C Gram-positive bacteria) TaxID=84139 RepID=UPI003BB72E0E